MLCVVDCVLGCVWIGVPQATEWQRIGDEIKPALSFARAYFVKVPRSGRGFGILSLYFNIDLFHSQIFRSSQPVRTITYFNSIFL